MNYSRKSLHFVLQIKGPDNGSRPCTIVRTRIYTDKQVSSITFSGTALLGWKTLIIYGRFAIIPIHGHCTGISTTINLFLDFVIYGTLLPPGNLL